MDGLMDGTPIKGIYFPDEHGGRGYTVGRGGVTKITVYYEYGQMAGVPWFNIWCGDKLISRVNAACVSEVIYQDTQPPSKEKQEQYENKT
jgi:hypothetical protein